MDSKSNDYPDSPPDGLGALKKIERLPNMMKTAPKIKWGDEYMSWPVDARLNYAEKLAASMNHAADVLQNERNGLLDIANTQERKIKELQASYDQQTMVVTQELGSSNAAQQELFQTIVDLKSELKAAHKRIRELEVDLGNYD